MKNVTIKDVAKAAGVSYSTVSRALTGSPEISEETRSRELHGQHRGPGHGDEDHQAPWSDPHQCE